MGKRDKYQFINREISWLSFNGRVLQEARDTTVPLFDRLAFLAIFSSNLDEFFRVRVASLRSLLRLKKKSIEKLDFNPVKLLKQIHRIVTEQQEAFGQIYRGQILTELEQMQVYLMDENDVADDQHAFVTSYFYEHVRPHIKPIIIDATADVPFLTDKSLFLFVELWANTDGQEGTSGPAYGIVEVPRMIVPRFVWIPGQENGHHVMFLEDIIRYNLPSLYPGYEVGAAYAVKLSRDADLYLEDEFSGNLIEQIRAGLAKRQTGLPCRLLYDLQMPYAMVTALKEYLHLEDDDLVPGGRYHNLHDLHQFPRFGLKDLSYEPLPPLPHPELRNVSSIIEAVAEKDYLVHYPYQSFEYIIRFLQEAARDPEVEEIWISLYRVASDSGIVRALLQAAQNGKRVTAFVEVKARFDEEPNLKWAEQMEKAGVRVLYSMPGLKVHAKLALVSRRKEGSPSLLAYLSTGNFNEKTARIYADDALFTADPRLTNEVRRVFDFLTGEISEPTFDHLLVAPFHLRKALYRLIDREIRHAREGREARILLKMNSLEDEKIIAKLYRASKAGVKITLIVRGICCLVPGIENQSENIEVRSIVDRFLEHSRVFIFHNDGKEEYYLASADWMKRNLSGRVEIAFPLYDEALRSEIRTMLSLQLADDTKARIIDARQENRYYRSGENKGVRAQIDTYTFLENKLDQHTEGYKEVPFTIQDAGSAAFPDKLDLPTFLGENRLFKRLNRAELELLGGYIQKINVQAGEVVLTPGQKNDVLFIVREGEFVKEIHGGPHRRYGVGDVLNEIALLESNTSNFDLRAVRDSTLYGIEANLISGDSILSCQARLSIFTELAKMSVENLHRISNGSLVNRGINE